MIFNSVIFSMGKPEDNLYIQMFLLCAVSIKKKWMLEEDSYIATTDQDTAAYIQKTFPVLNFVKYVVVPKPKSVYDGMTLKYVLPYIQKVEDVVYVDVDIFAIRRWRPQLYQDSIVVIPEGLASDQNYCGDMKLEYTYGFTAGMFCYRWGDKTRIVFDAIINDIQSYPKKYYTLDQPYFNKNLKLGNVLIMDPAVLSGNGNNNLDRAAGVNCCGEPGDGLFHWNKMLQLYVSLT